MNNKDMPAMPIIDNKISTHDTEIYHGLTKREHFAGLAMQAYISGNLSWSDGLEGGHSSPSTEDVAKEAVGYADALLKALED